MSELHVVYGAGPLGRSVMEELVRRGKSVRVVSRSGQMAEAPQGVELVAGDLYDAAAVRRLTEGAAAAYQCSQPHYWEWPQKFPPLQAAIIEGLAGTNTRLVIGENTYMYGDTDGKPLTEDLPYAATTRKGKVRAALSEAALAAHRAGKVQVTMGRGSDFFGPWAVDSGFGDRVFYPALAGKGASFGGKLDLPHTATYIGDFGGGAGDPGRAGRGAGPGVARAQRSAADHPAPARRADLPGDRSAREGERREQADDDDGGPLHPRRA